MMVELEFQDGNVKITYLMQQIPNHWYEELLIMADIHTNIFRAYKIQKTGDIQGALMFVGSETLLSTSTEIILLLWCLWE